MANLAVGKPACFVQQWHIDEVRQNMRDTIQQNYGVDIGTNDYNSHITYTWDTVQQWVCVTYLLSVVSFLHIELATDIS